MKKGFTLIELLVVVLIIGILSSVALPQYQRAVNRARGTEALLAGKAIADAQNVYFLANSSYDIGFHVNGGVNLDIEYPSLKYFTIGTGGTGCSSGNSCYISLSIPGKAVSLVYQLSKGKLINRYCSGADCKDYFSCVGSGGSNCYFN